MSSPHAPGCSLLDFLPFCALGASDSEQEQPPNTDKPTQEQTDPYTEKRLSNMQQRIDGLLQRFRHGTKAESTEWVSAIVQTMWPAAAEFAPEIFKDYIEPAINANLPPIIPMINFKKVQLGKIPPEIKSIRVLPPNDDRPDFIYLEAEFDYNGDMSLEMGVDVGMGGVLTVGSSDMTISGKLEVLVGPRVPKIPFFEAFQVGFLSPPEIDFKLTKMAGPGNLTVFKDIIRQITAQILNELFSLPSRLCFPVFPEIDYLNCTADHIGVLRIAVLNGKGFPKSDAFNSPPDVYIRLRHCGVTKDTAVIDNTTAPVYKDQVIDFAIASTSETQNIYINARDYDLGRADDEIGHAKITLAELLKKEEHTIKLYDEKYRKRPQLTIKARKCILSYGQSDIAQAISLMSQEKNNRKNCSRLLLKINIFECEHLPPVQGPYLKIKVKDTNLAFETGSAFHGRLGDVKLDASHPIFMMTFTAFIEHAISDQQTIEFSVKDRMTGNKIAKCTAYITDQETTEFKLTCDKSDKAVLRASIRLAAVIDTDPFWNHH